MSYWASFLLLIQWILVCAIIVLWLYGAEEFALKLAEISAVFMAGMIVGGVVW